jgi:Na+/proline symporter
MTRWQLLWLHVSVAITAITGIVFAVMKYMLKNDDEFSVINHPWQPHMLSAHVVVAPLLLFVLGWTFSNHMLPKFRFSEQKRVSGIASMSLILPMALSAYLLQIATNESLRTAMAAAHWITSGLFVITYALHLFVRARSDR